MAGNDRKLQMALEQSFQEQLGSPNSDRLSISPFGPLTDRLSRQTLIYLITTLNCAFPYYDFSYVAPLEPKRRGLGLSRAIRTYCTPFGYFSPSAPNREIRFQLENWSRISLSRIAEHTITLFHTNTPVG